MQRTETCKTCEHLKPKQPAEGLPNNPGHCTRYPEWTFIRDWTTYYCGEWEEKTDDRMV